MPKVQTNEAESLDEKIKRIRKKNEEIERRRQEVEADKQTAAKLNALVQLSPPKEDWPPPRSYSPEDDRPKRLSNSSREKVKENVRGNVNVKDPVSEANRPPPDPVYRFLADAERDPLPPSSQERLSRATRGNRGNPGHRGRGRDFRRSDGPPMGRNQPGYDAWRAERNRIDEERIQRQRTAQGQWRREWDNQKSEEDWESAKNNQYHKEPLQQQQQQQQQRSYRRPLQTFSPDQHQDQSGRGEAEQRGRVGHGGDRGSGTSPHPHRTDQGPRGKAGPSPPEGRVIQSSGDSICVSFSTEITSTKVPPRKTIGSGRLGLPPKPRKSSSSSANDYGQAWAAAVVARSESASEKPGAPREQRPRLRARRRAPASKEITILKRKDSADGDDSWEDAEDFSDGERTSETAPVQTVERSGRSEGGITKPEGKFEGDNDADDDCQVTSSENIEPDSSNVPDASEVDSEEAVFESTQAESEVCRGIASPEAGEESAFSPEFPSETNERVALPKETKDSGMAGTPNDVSEGCVGEEAAVSDSQTVEDSAGEAAAPVESEGKSSVENTVVDASLPATVPFESSTLASTTGTSPESVQSGEVLSGFIEDKRTIADSAGQTSEVQSSEVTTSLESAALCDQSESGDCLKEKEVFTVESKTDTVGDETAEQADSCLKLESSQEAFSLPSGSKPVFENSNCSASKTELQVFEPSLESSAASVVSKRETEAGLLSGSAAAAASERELPTVSSTNEANSPVLDKSSSNAAEYGSEVSTTSADDNQQCSSVEADSQGETVELAETKAAGSEASLPDSNSVALEEQKRVEVSEGGSEVSSSASLGQVVAEAPANQTNAAASSNDSKSSSHTESL